MKKTLVIFLCFLVLGCNGIAVPTSTPASTLTALPAHTQTPTRTPTKTATPRRDYEALTAIYSYDASAPLDVTWGTEVSKGGAHLQIVSYLGTEGCPRAGALLVEPGGSGPYPAVIYLHRVPANRTQFLDEAVELAEQGVVSLLLDSPFDLHCYILQDDSRQGLIDTVVFIRRGIDFLVSIPQVDATRLAYVGHSFGANLGGVVAGVDPRIHYFVLMAGVATLSKYNSPIIEDLDAYQYISHADEDVFLFQFGTNDEYIVKNSANYYYSVASGEKSILWYETDHQGVQWQGQADRVAWLLQNLGVTGAD